MQIKAGQRVCWKHKDGTYHYGDLLPGGANLTENGLKFCINDKVSHLCDFVPCDLIHFDSHKRNIHGDFFPFKHWIEALESGYITDYDGSASFTDGEYTYSQYELDPFNVSRDTVKIYKNFTGVLFYGK